jgi:tetratricopeptide (TPR) repeat protein
MILWRKDKMHSVSRCVLYLFLVAAALQPSAIAQHGKLDRLSLPPQSVPAACKQVEGSFPADSQTGLLYQYQLPALPPIVAKHVQSFECNGRKGSIFYFQYLDPRQAYTAQGFASGLLWGLANGPSLEHPTQLLRFNNVLVAISFRDSAEEIRRAVEATLRNAMALESREVEQLNKSLANDSGDVVARIALGKAFLDAGDPDKALTQFREAQRRGWKNSSADAYFTNALTLLGKMYHQQGNHPATLTALQMAVAFGPDDAMANTLLADEYLENPQSFAEGIVYLNQFVQAGPHSATQTAVAYYSLGRIYTEMKREKDAIDAYEQALRADPKEDHVLNNLAWLYASATDPQLRRPAAAVEYATRAVDISGRKDANYLDTLAEAYNVNGQLDKAIEVIKSAMVLEPGNHYYRDRLQKFEMSVSQKSQR